MQPKNVHLFQMLITLDLTFSSSMNCLQHLKEGMTISHFSLMPVYTLTNKIHKFNTNPCHRILQPDFFALLVRPTASGFLRLIWRTRS